MLVHITGSSHPHYHRAVAAYLKVVRRRKSWSAEGTRGGEHERGIILPLVRGASPRIILNFERVYMLFKCGFYAFGTRF